MRRFQILSSLFLIAAAAGCAGSADSGASGSPGGGGSNVGFGGAQDIGQFRDILDQGAIPGPDTLDANGFFNEHFTEVPKADCGLDLCLHGMVSVSRDWMGNGYQAVLRVALNTPLSADDVPNNPLDLVVVVDTSGSMLSDDRLVYVKQGLHLLIDELDEGDRLGIVSYASTATLVASLSDHSREELHALVDSFVAVGGTNIYDGLQIGMQMASEQLAPSRQSRVILLSDGLINQGGTEEDVVNLSTDYVAQGIGLTTIGVGDDFNVDLMRGLAERGAGNFYYVEDSSAVAEVFTEELDYFVQPLALDLQVSVQADPSHQIGEVLGTRLWQTEGSDGGSMAVPAVFMSSRVSDAPGENGRRGGGSSLFIAMNRAGGEWQTDAMATVQASYRVPGTDEVVSQTIVVDNPFREEVPDAGYVSHLEMLEAYAMYNVFLGLREVSTQAQWDYNCALMTIETLSSSSLDWNANNPDADLTADLALISQFEANLRAAGADSGYCYQDDYGEQPYEDDIYYDDSPMACSASGATGSGSGPLSLGLFLMALGWVRRSRRSR